MNQNILQYLNERSAKEIQSSQDEIEKQKRYQNALQDKLSILKSKLLILESGLNKIGLEISDVRYSINDLFCLNVTINAKPNSDKFKFIAFQGYTKQGAGKNRERLQTKAHKIAEQLSYLLDMKVYINEYSLEIKNNDEKKSVLISMYLQ